jgi:tetratricopeptide (TPR) repeat protein
MKTLSLLLLLILVPSAQPAEDMKNAIRFYEKGEFKEAVKLFLQLRNASPDDGAVRLWLGKSYLKIRDWDNAVREIEKSTELQPSNAHHHLWLGRACGAKASHSVFLVAPKWARRVLKEFETARTLSPSDLDVRFDLLEFYLEAPGIMGGGKDKANAEVSAISKLDPRKGYLARSTVLIKEKKPDQAQKELLQATLDYPDDPHAFKDLAEYLLGRQDYAGALKHASKALALDHQSKGSLLVAAAAQTRLRTELDDVERILTGLCSGPLTDNDPAFEEAHYWLGECFLAKGEKAKAREAFKTALNFNPEDDRLKERISELR